MKEKEYDFSGWATRNDIRCSDGRIIKRNAFKQNDGQKVPLVWNHQHNDPSEVLGHALLENRDEGVYAYCKFNNTESGKTGKELVLNGDVDKLSIYANKLKSEMNNVVHGCIREVSLVLAGANPGAFIDSIIAHSDENGDEEEGIIYTDEHIDINSDSESETDDVENQNKDNSKESEDKKGSEDMYNKKQEELNHSDDTTINDIIETIDNDEKKDLIYSIISQIEDKGKISSKPEEVKTLINGLNSEQQDAVFAAIGIALEEHENSDEENEKGEEEENMKHNIFESDAKEETLVHAEIIADAIADAKKIGSMRESFIEHAAANGFDHVDYLFPDAVELNNPPKVTRADESWVAKVMNSVKHSPFSRVKTTFAKMDEAQARAKGYIKGNEKANMKLALLRRTTTPTTVYLKNTMDRDDIVDITNFDVVAWIKAEMRRELDKDLATAILIGDGREISDNDKINEQNIRPILTDDEFYSIKYTVTNKKDYDADKSNDSIFKGLTRAAIKARKNYRGSGSTTFFTTETVLSELLLLEDMNGHRIYKSINELATAMLVKDIVTVPEMERVKDLFGIIVNLEDYTVGADKGGAVNMFDDFDIDYNQQKYLIETRMSGALNTPYSAIVLKSATAIAG